MKLLDPAHHHAAPFPHFTCAAAMPKALLEQLLGLFEADQDWQHHHDSFYEAFLAEIGDRLPAELSEALIRRMAELTGLPLVAPLRATIQRMEPGQYAKPHTDRPLLGYEAARLIVQLSEGWTPTWGGCLALHDDASGQRVLSRRPPLFNTAFGFVMGPSSFHSVEPVTRQRRTAVFNFQHAGNSEALAVWVEAQMKGMRFGALPALIDPVASEAERTRPEEESARAGVVAWLLHRWGFEEAVVVEGYRRGLEALSGPGDPQEILFARWVQRLAQEDFSVTLFAALDPELRRTAADPRLDEGLRLAFPPPTGSD